MAIEIVDFPIKNGDFPLQTVSPPEGICSVAVPTIVWVKSYPWLQYPMVLLVSMIVSHFAEIIHFFLKIFSYIPMWRFP